MTTVCVMQPTYLPWLGYCDLLDQADIFVVLDTVAISRQSWQTRNRIRARDGNVVWLSVPTTARLGMLLNQVEIANEHDWRAKHRRTIESAYGHAPHFDSLRVPLDVLAQNRGLLVSLNVWMMCELVSWGNMPSPRLEWASDLGPLSVDPILRLADICSAVGATEYLSPAGSQDYLEGHDIGVPIRWHEYEHPVYDQGGAPFVSHLSVVDLIAWHGMNSAEIIRSGRA